MEGFSYERDLPEGRYTLKKVFRGLEQATPLLGVFGEALDDILNSTDVHLITGEKDLYMYINDEEGSVVVGTEHLQNSQPRVIYLDIVHELVHIKQHNQGLHLFDEKYEYVDRPTEIEAYTVAVKEAQRLGMSDGEILDYLYVEWVTNDDVLRLARNCGLKV